MFHFEYSITDGANSITWYEPPPVETTTDDSLVKTHNIQLLEGSINEPLNWKFSLGQNLNFVVLQLLSGTDVVATIVPSGQADITAGFGDRFNVSWISQKATLVIFKVTAIDNGEFSCKVTTSGGGVKVWTRKIKVNVVGRFYLFFLNNMQCICTGLLFLYYW